MRRGARWPAAWPRGLAALLALATSACGPGPAAPAPAPAAAPAWPRELRLRGHVIRLDAVEVGSLASGRIAWVGCEEGQAVRAGQVCAALDARALDAEVLRDEASLRSASARAASARTAAAYAGGVLARAQRLAPEGIVSQEALEAAEQALEQARTQAAARAADADAAAATLRASRLRDAEALIMAPVDGVIVERRVARGQVIVAALQAPTLFVIEVDGGRAGVVVEASWSASAQMQVGASAVVELGVARRRVAARIRRVAPSAVDASRCVLTLEFTEVAPAATPGTPAAVLLEASAQAGP